MIIASDSKPWLSAAGQPLLERHGAAPADLVAHVNLVNLATMDAPEAVRPATVDAAFLADVRQAIAGMPEIVLSRLDQNFLGVYFAHNLGSSAVSDLVLAPDGGFLGLVVALDVDTLASRSANEWATWKDNTPFGSHELTLAVRIAEPRQDNRQNAIQYLLLHEFGHLLAAGRNFLPDSWGAPADLKEAEDYSFLPLSWQITADKHIAPLPENDFPQRGQVVFYAAPQLSGPDLVPVHQALSQTSFVSLYAAISAHEDFAESFALYVHAELLGKPYQLSIHDGEQLLFESSPSWDEPRFAGKRALFRRFLPA